MKDQKPAPKDEKDSDATFSNADGTVGAQGVFNDEVTIYVAGPDDPPEQRLRVAKNYLAALLPSQAQELLTSVIAERYCQGEAAYYWMLAILSGKALADLDEEGRYRFRSAWKQVEQSDDHWLAAAKVIKDLIVLLQDPQGDAAGTARMDQVLASFEDLPEERREEIRRHLDTLFTTGLRRQLEHIRAERIRGQRLGNERKRRVPKFFEPVPYPPQSTLSPRPTLHPAQAVVASVAILMGATGALWGESLSLRHGGTGPVLTVSALVCAALLGWLAPVRFPIRFSPWQEDPATKTSDKMRAAVKRVFERVRRNASDGESTEGWSAATRAVQTVLTREYASVYGSPKVPPGGVDYLIKRHAQNAWKRFRDGKLNTRPREATWFDCAAVALAVIALGTVIRLLLVEPTLAAGPIGLTFCAGLILPASHGDVFLIRLLHRSRERVMAAQRLLVEKELYVKRLEELADRPDDTEMARWLDDDKHYFRTLVLKQYGMDSEDVIADAVLTEPAPGARRSRVRRGPWRYSSYRMWIYLLTNSGVRQIAVHLDFASGTLSNQERTAFRYDSVASASIIEIGICFDEDRRAVLPPSQRKRRPPASIPDTEVKEKSDGKPDTEENETPKSTSNTNVAPVMLQLFRLMLVNRERFTVTVEQLAEVDETVGDDVTYLRRLALDDSGVSSALRILEQVAAEGSDWVRHAQMRAQQIIL
ncbi:hypothetical protein BTM25_08010 [Actinomadura rubteroloni]|uniref:Uncharacterized protein n=1 Tax=Actinomadura rubteroloni TaxID=1926885 RepID=A0A2P4UMX5_9ACTN|nr:hypothetical protein [Actinomadura rubteroloni]POM26402.1 hypothetical protein BTM25_08010 [Actinomadura rubteroloni]